MAAQGGEAVGVRAGERYVDVGTLHGYREAIGLLSSPISTRSAVIFRSKVRDQRLAPPLAQGVLQLLQLYGQVVLRIQTRARASGS